MEEYRAKRQLRELNNTRYEGLALSSLSQGLVIQQRPVIQNIKTVQPVVTSSFMASSASILPCLSSLRETAMITHTIIQGGVGLVDDTEKLTVVVKTCLNLLITKNMKVLKSVPVLNVLPHVLMSLHFVRLGGMLMQSTLFPNDVIKKHGKQLVKAAGLFGMLIEIVSKMLVGASIKFYDNVEKLTLKKMDMKFDKIEEFVSSLPDELRKSVSKHEKDYYNKKTYNVDRLEHLYTLYVPRIMKV